MGIYIIYTGMFHMNQEHTKYHLQPKLICRACPVTDLFWKGKETNNPLLCAFLATPGKWRLYTITIFYQILTSLPQFPKILRSDVETHGRYVRHVLPLFPAQHRHRRELKSPTQKSSSH